MDMNVIQRNFFRLLSSGAFGVTNGQIEPMSPWKWNRLYNISLMHGVAALVNDGMANYAYDFFLQIPAVQTARWDKITEETEKTNANASAAIAELFAILNKEQLRPILLRGVGLASLYDNPLHRTCGDVDIYFPYDPQAKKAAKWAEENVKDVTKTDKGGLSYSWHGLKIEHYTTAQRLTNILLNRKLQSIINSEIRCCDSKYIHIQGTRIEVLPHTLCLLLTMVRIARYTLNEGISLKQIVDMGVFLRKAGSDIDFVKLHKWISLLQLGRMADKEGAMLVNFFNFEPDEIPFMNPKERTGIDKIVDDAFLLIANHNEDWYFTQGKNIFVRTSNYGAMTWQLKHLTRFFNHYPAEAITSFASSFAHSLTHIEE